MDKEELNALLKSKQDADAAYAEAVKNNPELLAKMPTEKEEDTTPTSNLDDDKTVQSLVDKIDTLTDQLATANKNHEDLIAKLGNTIESFNRDEADGGANGNTDTDGVY